MDTTLPKKTRRTAGKGRKTVAGGKAAGVVFAPDVLNYIEKVGQGQIESRSWLMNMIIREHAMLTKEKFGESRLVFNPNDLIIKF